MTAALTDQERDTIRTAGYGAVVLVSIAYPSTIATTKANIVGAKILTGATGVVGEVLSSKGKTDVGGGSAAQIASVVLPALSRSVEILAAKAPDEVDPFRRIVTIAVEQSASSTGKGISPAEQEMISKIKSALGAAA